MRMFHHLNKSEEALTCFKSDELIGFFDQYMSYQLLLDLLYENQKYNQILEVFDIIKNKQLEGTKYPKNVVTFVLAACYKLVIDFIIKNFMQISFITILEHCRKFEICTRFMEGFN